MLEGHASYLRRWRWALGRDYGLQFRVHIPGARDERHALIRDGHDPSSDAKTVTLDAETTWSLVLIPTFFAPFLSCIFKISRWTWIAVPQRYLLVCP